MPDVPVEIKGGVKEAKDAKAATQKPTEAKAPEKAVAPGVKQIVRIVATDIRGNLPTIAALRRIRGVSHMFANAICISTGVDGKKLLGSLSESEVKTLQDFIVNQSTSPTLPTWFLNRRNDPETGTCGHVVGTTLIFKQREDINFMRRIRCRRGIRHELGLPVRGQHTRTTGRHGRGVGVVHKKAAPAAAPKAAAAAGAAPAKSAATKAAAKSETKK